MLQFDHVIAMVHDLDAAAEVVRSTFGWGAIEGGRHPGGTTNRAIPLGGQQYLELLAVDDDALPTGPTVAGRLTSGEGWLGWAVRDDDLDATAARLGVPITEGSIETSDGRGSWRLAGVDGTTATEGALPFFIDYGVDRTEVWERRYAEVEHRDPPAGIAWVEVGVGESELTRWLGAADLDVRAIEGPPGLRAVGIRVADERIVEIRDWPASAFGFTRDLT